MTTLVTTFIKFSIFLHAHSTVLDVQFYFYRRVMKLPDRETIRFLSSTLKYKRTEQLMTLLDKIKDPVEKILGAGSSPAHRTSKAL